MNKYIFCIFLTVATFIAGCGKADETPQNEPVNNISVVEENIENSGGLKQAIVFNRDDDGKIIPSDDEQEVERNSETDAVDVSEVESEETPTESIEQEMLENIDGEEKSEESVADFYAKALDDDIKLRITGITYPNTPDMQITYDDLRYVHVLYKDFNNNTCEGEIICNKSIAGDFVDIFKELYEADYQIDKIRLIDEYGGDDDISCEMDNTSCFNYRVVDGTSKLSKHSYGTAIDINPMYNPYVKFKDGVPYTKLDCSQPYIDRTLDFPHKIDENDLCYKVFKAHGFTWGGSWKNSKDYQHFEKP